MTTATKAATNGRAKIEALAATVPQEAAAIDLPKVALERIWVPIVGLTPLVLHAWDPKNKRKMLDAMTGVQKRKERKDTKAEYEAARYRFADGGDGVPALAFLSATISAARLFGKAMTMTLARQLIFVSGEMGTAGDMLCRLEGVPAMREDVVRVARGGTDLRYRPQFTEWKTVLEMTYISDAISRGSVVAMVDAGGLSVGVGEWRPERHGVFGRYKVDDTRPIDMMDAPG